MTLTSNVMAQLVRATCRRTVLVQVARTSWAMTFEVKVPCVNANADWYDTEEAGNALFWRRDGWPFRIRESLCGNERYERCLVRRGSIP